MAQPLAYLDQQIGLIYASESEHIAEATEIGKETKELDADRMIKNFQTVGSGGTTLVISAYSWSMYIFPTAEEEMLFLRTKLSGSQT